MKRLRAAMIVAAACSACAPEKMAQPPFVPHALSGTVSWQLLVQRETKSARPGAVVVVDVKGGELLRLETSSDTPFAMGERVHASGGADVEEWSTVTPHERVALVRPALFTTAVLLPRGAAERALVGHGYDPGYLWFELESRVLGWASGPLPAPFPQIAPHERIDLEAIAALDRALADAVASARDRDAAMGQARAIRRVVGLRAARLLRPVSGFPYFFDSDTVPEGHPKTREDGEKIGYEVTPEAPLDFVVNGPTLLHLWSRAPPSEDGQVEHLRVTEGGRERATSGATLPHVVRGTTSDPSRPDAEGDDPASLSSLRRATVHVPPGEHRYHVEMSGGSRLWVYPLRGREIVHIEDAMAEIKSETHQLAHAEDACHGGSSAICAFALALGGKDADGAPGADYATGWRDALASLGATPRGLALDLARGGPRDPSLPLEIAASSGDESALVKLSTAAASETDDVLRDSWMRAVLRGTHWVGVESDSEGQWTALLVDEAAAAKCQQGSDASWIELGSADTEVATTPWQGIRAVDLAVDVPCDAQGPVQLVVDGETLAASPSSGHARWRVLVHGATAHARRVDSSGGHVLAMRAATGECGAHWGRVGEPQVASSRPQLTYEAGTRSPGLEIWLRDGSVGGSLELERPGGEKMTLFVHTDHDVGVRALDERGVRWTRAARVPLPAWAASGIVATGADDLAVRALVRAPRSEGTVTASPKPAEPLDEAHLTELSRAILTLPPSQRGPAYLRRALALASGGATKGALEDARAAKALGLSDPDPEVEVRAASRSTPSPRATLAPTVKAYGVEPDFDLGAPRCKTGDAGPRARLLRLEGQLREAAIEHTWDPSLATRALEVARANPNDPRADALVRRSMWGSRWQLVRSVQGSAPRVVRPRETAEVRPVDASGELRPRVAAGDPFAGSSFVTVTNERPARAILSGAPGASPHVDFVCVPLEPAAAVRGGTRCPIQVTVGDSLAPLADGPNGGGHAQLPPLPAKGNGEKLAITMPNTPGGWVALARIVFDREVPGSTKVAGVGWVLEPPVGGRRFLLKGTDPIAVDGPGLIRVDAIAEPNGATRVIASADGHDETIPLDGTPITLAAAHGPVSIRAEGGAATVAVARRIPRATGATSTDAEGDDAVAEGAAESDESRAPGSTVIIDPAVAASAESWRSIASHSPRPLTGFEDDLGVVIAGVTASYGSFRADTPNDTSIDESIQEVIGYRRRIERLSLWTIAGLNVSERPDGAPPTYGGSATFYEDYDPAHLRVTGTFDYDSQAIEGNQVQTINPRGFIEYSWRTTRAFFILPRLGYDGWYSTLRQVPKSTVDVDDSVYNAFRSQRQTFGFLQSLFWLTPFINDIYYVRARVTYDLGNAQLSHIALRPGVLLAFAGLDINGYFDSAWYEPVPYVRPTAGITNTAGLTIEYNFWSGAGSLDIQPGVAGFWNDGGGYTVEALFNVMAGYRRGLRDYSSLELDFPEQLSDGVPWRGAPVGIAK